mgnify:CR=1 FL=1
MTRSTLPPVPEDAAIDRPWLRFALPLYVLNQTGSAALMGAVSACAWIPYIELLGVAPVAERDHRQVKEQLRGRQAGGEQRDHLHGLAQTHVVSEDAACPDGAQRGQPLQSALLVGTKLGA